MFELVRFLRPVPNELASLEHKIHWLAGRCTRAERSSIYSSHSTSDPFLWVRCLASSVVLLSDEPDSEVAPHKDWQLYDLTGISWLQFQARQR